MYATIETLISLFGKDDALRLSDREQTGEMNEDVLNDALVRASSEVDSYLAGHFRVPLEEPAPAVVASITCDVARYRLCGGDVEENSPILVRYERAVGWLRDVAAGKAGLPGYGGTGGAGEAEAGVLFARGSRPWSRESVL